MTDKKRVLTGLLIAVALVSVITMGLGGVSGQILSEETYYENDFTQHQNESVEIASDSNLQNQYLTTTGEWTSHGRGGIDYGGTDTQARYGHIDPSQPWLQKYASRRDEYGWHEDFGLERTVDVPDGMSDPVLVVEYANYRQKSDVPFAISVDKKVATTRAYDSSPGRPIDRAMSPDVEWNKMASLAKTDERGWTTTAFPVTSTKNNVTVRAGSSISEGGYDYDRDRGTIDIRNMYWSDAGANSHSASIDGFEAVPEDDSFGGPDADPLQLVTVPTADGKQTSIRSHGQTVTREFTLDGIDDARKAYFVLEGTSNSEHPVQYTIEAFGQEQASGSIGAGASSEETTELDLNTDEVTVTIESEGQYDIHNVGFSALEQTSAGDPLATNSQPSGITLDPDTGYDRTVGLLITGLDLTTDTLLYIIMTALAIGAMVFSYTKSVRGQEMAQSLIFGAAIAGIVIVGVVPTMNLATWVFSGGIDRAPLADPALEAEPPTYYSTEFQDGTMHGWSFDNARGQGSVRPVSSGETFNLQFSGTGDTPGIITHQEHISLGNSLDTGFVNIDGAAESVGGYNSKPHEVTYNVRVYVTEDGELEDSAKLDPQTNFVENDKSARELRNPVTGITKVEANIDGTTYDLSNDFVIADAADGELRYTGNETLASQGSETLSNPSITYETYNDGSDREGFSNLEPGDTVTVSKSHTSTSIYSVEEVARSFNGETMTNEQLVTFPLDGSYVHTELIVRSNRDDENPGGVLSSVRVGATTEGGSVEH